MQQKFNESLVQKVREGKLAVDALLDKTNAKILWDHIYPENSANQLFHYYWRDGIAWCTSLNKPNLPMLPVSDFFLQPPTEKEDKERTYRVTREALLEIHNRATHNQRGEIILFALNEFPTLKNEYEFTKEEVSSLFESHDKPTMSLIFPDFNPTPHIPKGEFAWVRDADHEEWLCKMSAGNGEFYHSQKGDGFISFNWKQVRKYEDRPF